MRLPNEPKKRTEHTTDTDGAASSTPDRLLVEQKRALRRTLRQWRRSLGPTDVARWSALICESVAQLPEWQSARVPLLYHALPGEVDLRVLASVAAGRRLVWPVVAGRDRPLLLRAGTPTVAGRLGILEPPPSAPEVAPETVDLVVVPGLAFDRMGRRLGQGGGFYDRTLALITAPRLAVCFSGQLVDHVPSTEQDLPMDLVVHEQGLFRLDPSAR